MILWFLRGARSRRLTTRYPSAPEPAPPGFRGRALLDAEACDPVDGTPCAAVCLPAALTVSDHGGLRLDAARCIGCGLCVAACPTGALTMDASYELATADRANLVVEAARQPVRDRP